MITIILLLAAVYLLLGLVFAIAFVINGVTLVDEGARNTGIAFRLIIIPGCILLWPVMLKKWITAQSTSHDKTT